MSVYKLGPATIAIEPVTAASGVTVGTGGCTDTDTTIPLSGDTSLPDKGIVTIGTEDILYTTHSSGSISNCIRGFRDTTAASHTASDAVTHSFSILGDTLGGITYTTEETSQQLKTDQAGETPVDEVITGLKATIEANLAEITLSNIAMIYKTTVQGSGSSRRVELKSQVGYSNLDNAKKAIIIPYDGADLSDDVEDLITFMQAGIVASGSRTYDGSNQQVIKLTMTGYPDDDDIVVVLGKEA